MQHREEPDVRAQMVRIAGYGQQGLGHSLKEEGRMFQRCWSAMLSGSRRRRVTSKPTE
jgi:hypothetical protein